MHTATLDTPAALGFLEEIAKLMRKQSSRDDDLWTADNIADYMQLSKSTVQGRILTKPGFPRAIVLPTAADGSGGGKRYLAGEVKAWAVRHRR